MTLDKKYLEILFISNTKEKCLFALLLGIFVSIFLGGYLPFQFHDGISGTGVSFIARVLSFGVTTACIFSLNEIMLKPIYFTKVEKSYHTFAFWVLWELFTGALLTFLLYNYFWAWNDIKLFSFLKLFLEYSAMMAIPLITYFLIRYQRLLAFKLKKVNEIVQTQHIISKERKELFKTFYSSNRREEYKINLNELLFIKSDGNYIKVHYLSDQIVKSVLIRTTLKTIEEELALYPFLLKCHRTFIVNTNKVKSYFRKNQNLTLTLPYQDIEIPVSKKYIDTVLTKLQDE